MATVLVSISRDSIRALQSAMKKLEYHDAAVSASRLWIGTDNIDANFLGLQEVDDAHVEAAVANVIDTIRQLKTLKTELEILSNSVEAVVEELSTVARPTILRLPIAKMPPEILSRIIELSERGDQMRLSSVCRRFRAVALNNSLLWRHVSNTQDPKWRDTLLSRSGACGLIITHSFTHCKTSRACELFWDSVVQHTDRWEDATLYKDVHHVDSVSSQLSQSSKLGGLYLPRLRKLRLYGDTVKNVYWDICRTWKTPALEHVDLDDLFLAKPFEISCHLVSLKITFYGRDPSVLQSTAANIRGLLSSVASTLRELSIRVLTGVGQLEIGDRDGHTATPPRPRVILPNLDHFKLSTNIQATNAIFSHVLASIYMPDLTRMQVSFDLVSERNSTDTLWLEWFMARGRIGARLKEVHVDLNLVWFNKCAKIKKQDVVENTLKEYWRGVLKVNEVNWPKLTFG